MTHAEEAVGRLVVCPTPIGNLDDVTLRVLAVLGEANVLACEDTRHTKVLLERHGLAVPLVSFHAHNERRRAGELVARIRAGEVVALVSDAGTPLVADPGFVLVRACLAAGLAVEVLPGPSVVVTALVASGLPADRWQFVGFLPRKRAELENLLAHASETLVAFESPRRLAGTLGALAAREPERPLAVCRELTKLHEEVRRGGAAELATYYGAEPRSRHAGQKPSGGVPDAACAQAHTASCPPQTASPQTSPPQTASLPTGPARGEVVLVLGAAAPERPQREKALAALRELIDAGARARPAAVTVAKLTGVGANELYRELTSSGQ
jgi:16S rRNA (cytidine1402-2'-O)-methyltransferase